MTSSLLMVAACGDEDGGLNDSDSATEGESDSFGDEEESATGTMSATESNSTSAGSMSGGGSTVTDSDDDGTGVGSAESGDCPPETVAYEVQIPTVALLIDQSSSMNEAFDMGTRWEVVRDSLLDTQSGVINNLQAQVRFGVSLYTSLNGDQDPVCPIMTEEMPALDNYDAISTLLLASDPVDDTPTGEAVTAVATWLAPLDEPGPKIIVLATDGEPDTCAEPDGGDINVARQVSVDAVTAAYDEDIRTFVISVANQVAAAHLQELANAGQGVGPGQPDATYYEANDQASIEAAFSEIINGVRSCVLTLSKEIQPGYEDQGTVTVNGVEIPFEDPDGWQVNSSTEIELLGEACETIQEGNVIIQIDFPCGGLGEPEGLH